MFYKNEEDRDVFHLMLESIDDEYILGKGKNKSFWFNTYNAIKTEKRIEFWMTIIARYEYMVHGEFKENSVRDQTQLIVKIIKEKDNNSKELLSGLREELIKRPLQNEDISEYMIKMMKELS